MAAAPNPSAGVIAALQTSLADCYALYIKTKNFHWHVTGRRFRDLHLLFDEHAAQILLMADPLAERARKLEGRALTSISAISRHQTIADNDRDGIDANAMVTELAADNRAFAKGLAALKAAAEAAGDIATSAAVDGWLDETQQRIWFLSATAE